MVDDLGSTIGTLVGATIVLGVTDRVLRPRPRYRYYNTTKKRKVRRMRNQTGLFGY